MNKTIEKFLESLNIDREKFFSLKEAQIKDGKDVNSIVSDFGLVMPKMEDRIVSIADIEGFDYIYHELSNENIIDNLSHFFDTEGNNGYKTRSASMLEIPSNELIGKLGNSFKWEPVHLNEVDQGKYIIGDNGLHRFHVIKTHYLSELSKLEQCDERAKEELKRKYSFEVKVSAIDFVKTYSSYVLSFLKEVRIKNHCDENYSLTDEVEVYDYTSFPPQVSILTNKELIKLVAEEVAKLSQSGREYKLENFKKMLASNCDAFESFKKYYDEVLSHVVQLEDENESGED